MDYIFRRLALDYLPYDKRAALGIFTAEERAAQVAATYGGSQLEIDVEGLAQSVPVEEQPSILSGPLDRRAWRGRDVTQRRALLGRAARGDHRQGVRRTAVHDLRHEDAPGRLVLRLRGLRQHQRLQLMTRSGSPRRRRPSC